jgi:hypothetical protein
MNVCVYSVCAILYVGTGLGVLPTVYDTKELKKAAKTGVVKSLKEGNRKIVHAVN